MSWERVRTVLPCPRSPFVVNRSIWWYQGICVRQGVTYEKGCQGFYEPELTCSRLILDWKQQREFDVRFMAVDVAPGFEVKLIISSSSVRC